MAKKFDIELAKKGHPVQTRSGLPVRILCTDRKSPNPIVALVSESEWIGYYNKKGVCSSRDTGEALVMAPIIQRRWSNTCIYGGAPCIGLYLSEEAARQAAEKTPNRRYIEIARLIEWEEEEA